MINGVERSALIKQRQDGSLTIVDRNKEVVHDFKKSRLSGVVRSAGRLNRNVQIAVDEVHGKLFAYHTFNEF